MPRVRSWNSSHNRSSNPNDLSLEDLWPLPFRKLTSEKIRRLSDKDFFMLCQRVRNRYMKYHVNSRKADRLVRCLVRRRKGLSDMKKRLELTKMRLNDPNLFYFRYRSDRILNTLCPNRKRKWISPPNRTEKKTFILKEFSFLDNPEQTLALLQEIASAECNVRIGRLNFDDAQILDIGPYIVWGIMSKNMAPFITGGHIGVPVQKVIESVNLRKFMRMAKFRGLANYKDVWAFPLQERDTASLTATPARAISFSIVADELVETINQWLGALPTAFELKEDAKPRISNIVTEILENAERHSPSGEEDGQWYVAGFMARRQISANDQYRDWHDCHIAFVNLGRTIADTILESVQDKIREDLDRYLELHYSAKRQSTETLSTLYAMQDGVSSLPEGAGGKGMMDMVELTNQLGRTDDPAHQPAITIISGSSCIRFDGPYRSCYLLGDSPNRVQAFNSAGELDSPPDMNYVFDMGHAFPGTIVAIRFSLDHEALEARVDESH